MRTLRRVLNDIKRGENLDAYVTVTAAVVLVGLNLAGLIPSTALPSVTLAVLALIAITLLVHRAKLENLRLERARSDRELLVSVLPRSRDEAWQDTGSLLTYGVSLLRTLTANYGEIARRLEAGDRVRAMLSDPDCPAAHLAHARIPTEAAGTDREAILASLKILRTLAVETGGNLEVRLSKREIIFSALLTNAGTARARLFVLYGGYKIEDTERMKLVLQPADNPWFQLHIKQLERLWLDAEPYELGG